MGLARLLHLRHDFPQSPRLTEEQQPNEDALATADALLRISIDRLLEGVQVIGFDWRYLYLNDTAARHGARPAGDLLGRTMMAAYPGIERSELFAVLTRVMRTREPERMLNEFTYSDGNRRWFELLIQPVPDGLCVLSLDVTDRLEAERQLQQAQKMEVIGQLTGGVAHDFNNMLTAILGYAELIAEQIGPDKPIGRDLQEIVAAGQRAAALTRQLLAFSRKQGSAPTALSLNALVMRVEPMLRRLIPENITIRTSLDERTHVVSADPTQLEQVLINLAVNARDAMPDGGVLTIATRNAITGMGGGEGLPAGRGEYAVVSVMDTGAGMPAAVRERIFEPFFTTKPRGRGTGLGLAVVQSIVKQLGGHIWVHSAPGDGTVFEVGLPAVHQAAAAIDLPAPGAAPVGRETILLVEDEPGVRSLARAVLTRYGYRVLEAGSAEDGLAILADAPRPIDLLLTDVVLSGIDGTQLAHRMRESGSSVPVVFMSGYAGSEGGSLPPDAALLDKPFTPHALLSRVRQALDRSGGGPSA